MIAQIEQFLLAWSITNFVSLVITFVCFKSPETGRRIFAIIFMVAGLFNAVLAILKPSVYIEYGRFSFLFIYEEFIYGTFSRNTTVIVLLIAICQIAIAGGLLGRDKLRQAAIVGAMLFLLAIIPLGVGSGFPATLFLIIGLWPILVKRDNQMDGSLMENKKRRLGMKSHSLGQTAVKKSFP